jgi:exonuclease III
MLKLVSWNIDGLARALPGPAKGRAQRIPLAELHRLLGEPDVLCLQEIRIRPEDSSLRESMARALPGFGCGYALCQDRLNLTFRGGRAYGVATYVREELAPRWLEPPGWDREGRFCAFELPDRGLLVANVYAVNGTAKPYLDRDGRVAGDRYAFKLLFQRKPLSDRMVAWLRPWLQSESAWIAPGQTRIRATQSTRGRRGARCSPC